MSGIYQFSGSLVDLTGEPRGALALTGGTTQARILFGDEQAFATELAQAQASMTLMAGRADLAATVRSTPAAASSCARRSPMCLRATR